VPDYSNAEEDLKEWLNTYIQSQQFEKSQEDEAKAFSLPP
jgi:hypothetical protein